MNVNINIEQLVLEGLSFPNHRKRLLQAAVEMELGRLFIANGLSSIMQYGGDNSRTHESELQLTDNAETDPADLGQLIAKAVYKGVSR